MRFNRDLISMVVRSIMHLDKENQNSEGRSPELLSFFFLRLDPMDAQGFYHSCVSTRPLLVSTQRWPNWTTKAIGVLVPYKPHSLLGSGSSSSRSQRRGLQHEFFALIWQDIFRTPIREAKQFSFSSSLFLSRSDLIRWWSMEMEEGRSRRH